MIFRSGIFINLCFTNSDMGLILSAPFTFLVGSFAPIALLALIMLLSIVFTK